MHSWRDNIKMYLQNAEA